MIVDVRPNNPPAPGRGPKRSRSPKRGSPKKKSWCGLFLFAWMITGGLVVYAAWWLALAGGQLVAFGLAAAIGGTP